MSALDSHTLIVGASGAGKTVTAKDQVERLLENGRHVCIIDPTGVWHGLRTMADGVNPGFAIPIFGGLRGDVPITFDQGQAVGQIIADGVSTILDLSQMDSDEQQRFVADLIAALRKKPRGNFHLVVDEADEFAPQTSPSQAGEAAKRQMEWIAKRGRVQGFVLMAITQRPADIAKSVISQMQTVIMHQLIAPADQTAVKSYLRDNADKATLNTVMGSLAGLNLGERWIYSPRAGVLERGFSQMPATFDTSKTPKPGEAAQEPKTLAEIDMGAIRAALAPKVEEENEPEQERSMRSGAEVRQLHGRIAELERQKDQWQIERAHRQEQFNAVVEERDELRCIIAEFQASIACVSVALEGEPVAVSGILSRERPSAPRSSKTEAALPQRRRSDEPGATAGEVAAHPPRHQRILDALAWATRMLGRDAVERNIVAWFAETSPKSSGYQNDLGAMRTAGLIEYPATGMLSLTQAGGELANWPRTAPTKRDLLDAIKARLEPRFCRILDALWGISSPMNRAELAEEVGISANSSGFQNDLGKLRTLGLVDYPKSGLVELGRVFA